MSNAPEFGARLTAGHPLVGGWCSIASTTSAEVMAEAGFDWICIDAQHGVVNYATVADMITALDYRDVPTLVRVAANDPTEIMRALDIGASGVIVPMINDRDEALRATKACRYPPQGSRSRGYSRRGLGDRAPSIELANRSVVCVLMIETVAGVNAIDDILDVPGISAIFVGPNDLALAYGSAGEASDDHERLSRPLELIVEACERNRVAVGIPCAPGNDLESRIARGFSLVAVATDIGLLDEAARASAVSAKSSCAATARDLPLQET